MSRVAQRYRTALRRYLKDTTRAKPASALIVGQAATKLGMDVLEVAVIHEAVLIDEALAAKTARDRHRIVRRAAIFFAEAIVPIEATHRTAMDNNATLTRMNRELEQRTQAIAASQRKLTVEVAKRKAIEHDLRQSERESSRLLRQSHQLQEDLRRLSRGILSTQEDERKRISRELHGLVAQTLTAIHDHLTNLQDNATQDARELKKDITRTQKLVERSVDKVQRFAAELRPAVLDDLGLIPALQAFAERFAKETGMRVHMTASAVVDELTTDKRTVLYRVAQDAFIHVARHAHAARVTVNIQERQDAVCMRIHNDGRSFDVERLLQSRKRRRMVLIGMRERVEMVGGMFAIESTPDHGTTITARVPSLNGTGEGQQT